MRLLLGSNSKIETARNKIIHEWVVGGCRFFDLLPNRDVLQDIAIELTSHQKVKKLVEECRSTACSKGEFVVLSHDETFKTCFSLIGQEKMSQKEDEIHTTHTIRGVTGCVAAVSPQVKTGFAQFKKAICDNFTDPERNTVNFIFSDNPDAVKGAHKNALHEVFPNVLGVGEDLCHLVFALEVEQGEKRTDATSEFLQLQSKFHVPNRAAFASFFDGFTYPSDAACDAGVWDAGRIAHRRKMSKSEWERYLKQPFTSHKEYVEQLLTLATKHEESLNQKQMKIVKNRSSYRHYLWLRNGSILIKMLPAAIRPRLTIGTTKNEQLHAEYKTWNRSIVQMHASRPRLACEMFAFVKLVTHCVEAYYPGLKHAHKQKFSQLLQVLWIASLMRISLLQARSRCHKNKQKRAQPTKETKFNLKRNSSDGKRNQKRKRR